MDRLEEKKKLGFEECCLKIEHWRKFRSDYEALRERLSTLADKLSYDIIAPFGPHAFMPGKLVHTNSITVLLGENWFTEMSTKQAVEFVNRRIQQCDKMLQDLEKEKEQFANFLEMAKNISEEHHKDIQEFYDDEKLEKWREQHKENVRFQKHKDAEERTKKSSQDLLNDEDYWLKLEDLEKIDDEEFLNSSLSETEDDLTPDSDIEEEEDEKKKDNEEENEEEKGDACSPRDSTAIYRNTSPSEKHVRWVDLSEAQSKCIRFTHSKTPPTNNQFHKKKNKRRRRNSSTSDFDEEESEDKTGTQINSPSDIYKCFSFSLQPSKPKSILKPSPTDTFEVINDIQNLRIESDEELPKSNNVDLNRNNSLPHLSTKQNMAFTGEVMERFGKAPKSSSSIIIPSPRPKSLFQRSRQGNDP